MKKPTGFRFTLMEMMLAVATLGILAAIAIPAYHDHLIRAEVAGDLGLSPASRKAVGEIYRGPGRQTGADNTSHARPAAADISMNYVSSDPDETAMAMTGTGGKILRQVAHGRFDGTARQTLNSVTLNAGVIAWQCAGAGIAPESVPANCR